MGNIFVVEYKYVIKYRIEDNPFEDAQFTDHPYRSEDEFSRCVCTSSENQIDRDTLHKCLLDDGLTHEHLNNWDIYFWFADHRRWVKVTSKMGGFERDKEGTVTTAYFTFCPRSAPIHSPQRFPVDRTPPMDISTVPDGPGLVPVEAPRSEVSQTNLEIKLLKNEVKGLKDMIKRMYSQPANNTQPAPYVPHPTQRFPIPRRHLHAPRTAHRYGSGSAPEPNRCRFGSAPEHNSDTYGFGSSPPALTSASIHRSNKYEFSSSFPKILIELKYQDEILDMAILSAAPLVQFAEGQSRNSIAEQLKAFDSPTIYSDREISRIISAIVRTGKRISTRVDIATPRNLAEILCFKPRVLHVSCHGGWCGEKNSNFFLAFEGENGELEQLTIEQLKALTNTKQLANCELVFINSCYSWEAAKIFIDAGVDYVVGVHSSTKILDSACEKFSEAFYVALVTGSSVEDAYRHAQGSVKADRKATCCCAHKHKPGCVWNKKLLTLNHVSAHDLHSPDSTCKCRQRSDAIHNPKCVWVKHVLPRLEIDREKYDGTTLICSNLRTDVDENELKSFASKFGANVRYCVISRDLNGKSLGIGEVRFNSKKDADQALSDLNNKSIRHNPVKISPLRLCCCSPELPHNESIKFVFYKKEGVDPNRQIFKDLKEGKIIQKCQPPRLKPPSVHQPFIGRNKDIFEIARLLTSTTPTIRCIGVTGAPGVGKATLLKAVANFVYERRRFGVSDGSVYVDLREKDKAVDAMFGISEALDLDEVNQNELFRVLKDWKGLILLSRCDQIVSNEPEKLMKFLEKMKTETKHVLILFSSRDPLTVENLPRVHHYELMHLSDLDSVLVFKALARNYLPPQFASNSDLLAKHPIFKLIDNNPQTIWNIAPLLMMKGQSLGKLEDTLKRQKQKQIANSKRQQGEMNSRPRRNSNLPPVRESKYDTSLDVLIETVSGPHPETKRLLALLSLFPGGLTNSDLDAIWDDGDWMNLMKILINVHPEEEKDGPTLSVSEQKIWIVKERVITHANPVSPSELSPEPEANGAESAELPRHYSMLPSIRRYVRENHLSFDEESFMCRGVQRFAVVSECIVKDLGSPGTWENAVWMFNRELDNFRFCLEIKERLSFFEETETGGEASLMHPIGSVAVNLVQIQTILGRHKQALLACAVGTRAVRRKAISDEYAEITLIYMKAHVLQSMKQMQQAFDYYGRALKAIRNRRRELCAMLNLERQDSDDEYAGVSKHILALEAKILYCHGCVARLIGFLPTVQSDFECALDVYRRLENDANVAKLLTAKATVLLDRREEKTQSDDDLFDMMASEGSEDEEMRDLKNDLREAHDIYMKSNNKSGQALSLRKLARAYLVTGHYHPARTEAKKSLDIYLAGFQESLGQSDTQNLLAKINEVLLEKERQVGNLIVHMTSSPLVYVSSDTTGKPAVAPVEWTPLLGGEWNILREEAESAVVSLKMQNVRATDSVLKKCVASGCRIFHFSCKARIGDTSCLPMENADQSGSMKLLKNPTFTGVGTQVVFLSCVVDVSVAQAFLDAGAHSVILCQNQEMIGSNQAMDFQRKFYASLFSGKSVGTAFTYATTESGCNFYLLLPDMEFSFGNPHHQEVLFTRVYTPVGPPVDCSATKCPTNISPVTDGFCGRNIEMYQALSILRDHKVVNLHGREGIGKTSLATSIGHYCRNRNYYPDGVYQVSLKGCYTAVKIRKQMFKSLNIAKVNNFTQLYRVLQKRTILMIVDDCSSPDRGAHVPFSWFIHGLIALEKLHLILISRDPLKALLEDPNHKDRFETFHGYSPPDEPEPDDVEKPLMGRALSFADKPVCLLVRPLSSQDSSQLLIRVTDRELSPSEVHDNHDEGGGDVTSQEMTDVLAKHRTVEALKGNPKIIIRAAKRLDQGFKLNDTDSLVGDRTPTLPQRVLPDRQILAPPSGISDYKETRYNKKIKSRELHQKNRRRKHKKAPYNKPKRKSDQDWAIHTRKSARKSRARVHQYEPTRDRSSSRSSGNSSRLHISPSPSPEYRPQTTFSLGDISSPNGKVRLPSLNLADAASNSSAKMENIIIFDTKFDINKAQPQMSPPPPIKPILPVPLLQKTDSSMSQFSDSDLQPTYVINGQGLSRTPRESPGVWDIDEEGEHNDNEVLSQSDVVKNLFIRDDQSAISQEPEQVNLHASKANGNLDKPRKSVDEALKTQNPSGLKPAQIEVLYNRRKVLKKQLTKVKRKQNNMKHAYKRYLNEQNVPSNAHIIYSTSEVDEVQKEYNEVSATIKKYEDQHRPRHPKKNKRHKKRVSHHPRSNVLKIRNKHK